MTTTHRKSSNGFTAGYFAALLLRGEDVRVAHTYCSDQQRGERYTYVGRAVVTQATRALLLCDICTTLLSQDPVNIETLEPVRVKKV